MNPRTRRLRRHRRRIRKLLTNGRPICHCPPIPNSDLDRDGPDCPKCGSTLSFGYGLYGGGCGSYEFCDNEACDYFYKTQDTGE